jgi:phosphopantothenoylcysteine synthetase/decarboxylase
MEDHNHRANAEAKLVRKNCDAIVLNGPENVGSDRASVEILTSGGAWSRPTTGSKRKVADHVVRLTERLVRTRSQQALRA